MDAVALVSTYLFAHSVLRSLHVPFCMAVQHSVNHLFSPGLCITLSTARLVIQREVERLRIENKRLKGRVTTLEDESSALAQKLVEETVKQVEKSDELADALEEIEQLKLMVAEDQETRM